MRKQARVGDSLKIRRLAVVCLIWLAAGCSQQRAATDIPSIDALVAECETRLLSDVDMQAFEGMDVPGTPGYALALAAQWYSSVGHLDWMAGDKNMRMVLSYGPKSRHCYLLDQSGYILADWLYGDWSDNHSSGSGYWWRRSDRNGVPVLTRMWRDFSDDGPTTSVEVAFELRAGAKIGEIERLQLAGEDKRDPWIDGVYAYDPSARILTIEVNGSDRLKIADDGRLLVDDYRDCFLHLAPCEDPPPTYEPTTLTYDARGNLIHRRRQIDGAVDEHNIEIVVNDRGDWVRRRFVSKNERSEWEDRHIVYWDQAQ